MATYHAAIKWQRKSDEDFIDNRYSRAHQWMFDEGVTVPASSSPHIVKLPFSDPNAVDPEEALVASLSSCHMLFFLSYAAAAGFRVDRYRDDAVGTMGKGDDGKQKMLEVLLRPSIVFGESEPSTDELRQLHHRAHKSCFIANSVNFPVRVENL